jgi:hypothetical protein
LLGNGAVSAWHPGGNAFRWRGVCVADAMKTLGEIGYEKWRSLLPPSAGSALPTWNRLPEGSRLGWEDVAKAIVDEAIEIDNARWQADK